MFLCIDACPRAESRTRQLAKKVLDVINGEVIQLKLYEEDIRPLSPEDLIRRDANIARSDYSDEIFNFARQFKEADEILIAAPYWDLSYPSILKCYIEALCINGLTFLYDDNGIPKGLCNAKRLIYVTTAGGHIPDNNFGYDYIRQLCTDLFGIKDTKYIKAEGLDIVDANVRDILISAEQEINEIFHT